MLNKEKIIPRGNWILVKPVDKESNELESGILLPTTEEQEQKSVGTVQAIGNKVTDITIGDKVIYGAYAGETIKRREESAIGFEEIDYKLLLDEDIIAFLVNN